jgi:hypothetical protein
MQNPPSFPRGALLLVAADRSTASAPPSAPAASRSQPVGLQRKRRLPSDTLIYDLLFRLGCEFCRRRGQVRILLWDGEPMMSRSPHDVGAHIVEGDVPERVRY